MIMLFKQLLDSIVDDFVSVYKVKLSNLKLSKLFMVNGSKSLNHGAWLFLIIAIVAPIFLSACVTSSSEFPQSRGTSKNADSGVNAMIHAELAKEYMRQKQFATAQAELETALRINSRHSHSNYMMALLTMQFEQYKETEFYFKRAFKADSENSSIAHDFGVFLCQTGRENKSIRYFDIAILDPLFDRVELSYMRAGECLSRINDSTTAEAYLKKALSLNSSLSPALYRLAVIKQREKQHLLARAYIERYFAITEPQPDSLLLAYHIESSMNAHVEANSYKNQLLTVFSNSEQAHSLRGSENFNVSSKKKLD